MLGILGTIIFLAGSILTLAAAVCWITILFAAFQEDGSHGILCLFVPFYLLYYAIAHYEGEKKNLLIAVGLGCGILGGTLLSAGGGLMKGQRAKRNMVRRAERDVQRLETSMKSAYKLFSEAIAEENEVKLQWARKELSSMSITDFFKDHPDMDADKSIESLAKAISELDQVFRLKKKIRMANGEGAESIRSHFAAALKRILPEDDLEQKIKDIKSSFKKLDEAFDLDLKL